MALFAKDVNEILEESIAYLKANTKLTSVGPGSRIRAILEILKNSLGTAYATFDFNTAIGFIYGARDKYLDYIADVFFGLQRLKSQPAQVSSQVKIIKFYTLSQNFGIINNSLNINIPQSTQIWAERSGEKVIYYLPNSVVLDSSVNEQFVEVVAQSEGSFYNVPLGAIKYHSFEDYTDFSNGSLLITNVSSIENGQDTESDENFRYRIIHSKLAGQNANETAIRLAALKVPGVSDVTLFKNYYGIGTGAVLVKSTTPIVSDETLSGVQAEIDAVQSFGDVITAIKPKYIEFQFYVKPVFTRDITNAETENVKQAIINTISDIVNNSEIGDPLYINYVAAQVISSHPLIQAIGVPNKFFEKIYVFIPTVNTKIKKELFTDYSSASNEKMIMSTDVTAVRFV